MIKFSCGQSLAALPTSADVTVAKQIGEIRFDLRWKETFVNADVDQARFDKLLVERVHQLLVVQPIGMLGEMLVGVIADSVTLK